MLLSKLLCQRGFNLILFSCEIPNPESQNLNPEIRATMGACKKLSGNEVYCTNASVLLMKVMLCSKLQNPKVLD